MTRRLAVRNHIRSKRDARTANRRAAVVLLLLYVYRYESYIARRVVFRPRRTRTHLGRTTRARTRTRLGATFPPNVVVPVVPATSKKSAFGRDGGALPRALGRERRESVAMSSRRNDGPGNNVAKVVTFESTQQQLAVYQKSEPNEVRPSKPPRARPAPPLALDVLTRTRASFPPDDAPTG